MARSPRPPASPGVQPVARTEQIELLDSPVRQDIVDTLAALGGEADVASVATELGRPADGLYYHFELLADGGLLQRVEADGARRYRIGSRRGLRLKLEYRGAPDSEPAVGRVVDRLLATARRDFRAALSAPETVTDGPRRELWASRQLGWVDEQGLEEINSLLARIDARLQGPRRAGCDRRIALSFVLAPLPVRGKRR